MCQFSERWALPSSVFVSLPEDVEFSEAEMLAIIAEASKSAPSFVYQPVPDHLVTEEEVTARLREVRVKWAPVDRSLDAGEITHDLPTLPGTEAASCSQSSLWAAPSVRC